ncbi:hypothetical protein K0U00_47730, partial [Paenibacillus sepulcri]|nr:hypothetical protein [Paenibacillus sepulcri]
EHVGHTHINKVEALPLKTALEQSERLAGRIQESAEARPENRHSTARSLWKGYERIDFYVGGREGFIIVPTTPAAGKPWIWRTEFFDAFPSVDMAMLEQGWCIAYYRLSNMYGCPYAVQLMHRFQSYLVSVCQLAEKTVLFGFSRGGLYAINYSAAYPQ